MKENKKIYLINVVLLILLGIGVAIFDFSLNLGKLHGLVFSLYLFYGSILIGIVNLIIFFYKLFKDKEKKFSYLISALIIPLLALGMAYLSSTLSVN